MESLFSNYDLQNSLDNQPAAMRERIEKWSEDYILTVPEEDLVLALTDEARWDPPVLGQPEIAADGEITHRTSDVEYGLNRTYLVKETQIEVYIPFSGDGKFSKCSHRKPRSHGLKRRSRQII